MWMFGLEVVMTAKSRSMTGALYASNKPMMLTLTSYPLDENQISSDE